MVIRRVCQRHDLGAGLGHPLPRDHREFVQQYIVGMLQIAKSERKFLVGFLFSNQSGSFDSQRLGRWVSPWVGAPEIFAVGSRWVSPQKSRWVFPQKAVAQKTLRWLSRQKDWCPHRKIPVTRWVSLQNPLKKHQRWVSPQTSKIKNGGCPLKTRGCPLKKWWVSPQNTRWVSPQNLHKKVGVPTKPSQKMLVGVPSKNSTKPQKVKPASKPGGCPLKKGIPTKNPQKTKPPTEARGFG